MSKNNELLSSEKQPVCPWCGKGFRFTDATVMVDGEKYHLPCAAEDADNATFDRDMGFD